MKIITEKHMGSITDARRQPTEGGKNMTTIRTAHHPLATATPGKAVNIALWTLQMLVALAFVAAGSGKLLGSPDMVALFEAVGIGQWLRYLTGMLEVLGALLLIV